MPFEEEELEEIDYKQKRLNVSAKKSILDNQKKSQRDNFEKTVSKIEENANSYNFKIAELTKEFKSIFDDQVLARNKTAIQVNYEKDFVNRFIKLASEMNNAPNEEESFGSLNCILILTKACFYQRDKINELGYKNAVLEKKLLEIEKKIATLDKAKANE